MARALVVGMGGLGCSAVPVLAKAGVRLTLCDFDTIEERNLGRQDLYTADDVGQRKVDVAKTRIDADVTVIPEPFDAAMIAGHDVVLDCTDEPGTRAAIHQACLDQGVPLVWAAVGGIDGQLVTVIPGDGPCLRCLWAGVGEPAACDDRTDADVLRRTGKAQGAAAAAVLMGSAEVGVLRMWSGKDAPARSIRFKRRPDCVCASA